MAGRRERDPDAQRRYATRALRAYAAMQREFHRPDGLYRRDGRFRAPRSAAHLWPFARAMVATLDLAGVPPVLIEGFDAGAEIADRLRALERYWDSQGDPPAYSSDLIGARVGGDRYYDDNAWIGLALVELERLRPGSAPMDRAEAVFRFAAGGWDPRAGGVFWVEQGRGIGQRNHDRNAISSAPNAALGLHLEELLEPPRRPGAVGPEQMYDWVLAHLDSGAAAGAPGTGLFWDKIRGDGSIDRALWSYNQGSMVGAAVLLARHGGERRAEHLSRAEVITAKALEHYAATGYGPQPPAFNAIFFRNLLLLHDQSADAGLRAAILAAMQAVADEAWERRRDRRDRFRFPDHGGVTLLNQSAMVQILALLAWDQGDYRRIA